MDSYDLNPQDNTLNNSDCKLISNFAQHKSLKTDASLVTHSEKENLAHQGHPQLNIPPQRSPYQRHLVESNKSLDAKRLGIACNQENSGNYVFEESKIQLSTIQVKESQNLLYNEDAKLPEDEDDSNSLECPGFEQNKMRGKQRKKAKLKKKRMNNSLNPSQPSSFNFQNNCSREPFAPDSKDDQCSADDYSKESDVLDWLESNLPDDVPIYIKRFDVGNQKMREKNYHKALKLYEKVVKADPNFYAAWYNLAVAYCCLTNHRDAIRCLQKAMKIRPNEDNSHIFLAQLYQHYNGFSKLKEMKKFANKSLASDLRNSKLYFTWGNIFAAFKQYENAIKYYTEAIKEHTEEEKVLSNQLQPTEEWEDFEIAFTEKLSKISLGVSSQDSMFIELAGPYSSYDLFAYLNLAQVLIRKGRHQEASEKYEELALKYPQHFKVIYFRHAQLYIIQEEFSKAVQMLAKIFVAEPVNPEALAKKEEKSKGIREFKVYSIENQDSKKTQYLKMEMFEEPRDPQKKLEASYNNEPEGYLRNWELAKMYISQGSLEEAELKLAEAHENSPSANAKFILIELPFDTTIKTMLD